MNTETGCYEAAQQLWGARHAEHQRLGLTPGPGRQGEPDSSLVINSRLLDDQLRLDHLGSRASESESFMGRTNPILSEVSVSCGNRKGAVYGGNLFGAKCK